MADWLGALTNPLTIAGFNQIKGQPFGESLTQAAAMQREQEHAQRQQQQFEMEKQKALREEQLAQALPQILEGVDWNNPQQAQAQLASAGLRPNEIATLFGIYEGGENLGLKKEHLGLEREELGLRRQQLQQAVAAAEAGQLSPEESAKIEKELRGEVAKESSEYKTVKSAFKKVEVAAKNPSPANDVSLLYGFMKLLDPGSVVRESEYATAENAAGVPERVRNIFNKALSGEKLTPEQRKDFVQSAKQQFKSQVNNYKETTKQYKDLSERYKVNPKNVVLFEPEEVEEDVFVPSQGGAIDQAGARAEAIRRGLIKE